MAVLSIEMIPQCLLYNQLYKSVEGKKTIEHNC